MRNIELKARLRDRAAAESVCAGLGAVCHGDIRQVDTYFPVREGRIKLREQDPGQDQLIFYHRPDAAEARASDYAIAPATPELKPLLAAALGVSAVVAKTRSLWLWENVRIHLDRVDGLGDFIEFEAVLDEAHDDADGHAKLDRLQTAFGLTPSDVLEGSYRDLIEQVTKPP